MSANDLQELQSGLHHLQIFIHQTYGRTEISMNTKHMSIMFLVQGPFQADTFSLAVLHKSLTSEVQPNCFPAVLISSAYLLIQTCINRSLSLLTCLIPYRTCLRVKVIYMQQRLGLHLRRQFSMLYDYISLNSSGPSRSRREINNDIMYTNTMEHCITQSDVTAASQPSAFYIIFFVYLSFYLSLRNFCVMGLFRTF